MIDERGGVWCILSESSGEGGRGSFLGLAALEGGE